MIPARAWLGLSIWAMSAAALFSLQVLSQSPIATWPSFPFVPEAMTTRQIILIYGVLPRAAVALLAGAALGLAGALLQRLLRNPMADPATLGVSAGAQLAIVAATILFPSVLDGNRVLVALAGGAAAALLVFLLGWRRNFEPVTMVISGLLIGVTCAALSAALVLSQGEYLMSLVTWNGGSLSQQDWSAAGSLALQLLIGLPCALLLVRPLSVLALGDNGARALGVGLAGVRVLVAALAVALAAGVAANVGLVSFVGLAGPAIARGIGARRPAAFLVLSSLIGGLLLWFCDGLVALLASSLSEAFPTGAVTGIFGGPLLLWLVNRVRQTEPLPVTEPPPVRRSTRSLLSVCALLPLALVVALGVARTPNGFDWLATADIWDLFPLRWPRLLASSGAGALLAIAGTILQRLTANPMASPEVIGVSGGAGIGFAAAISLNPDAGLTQLFLGAGVGALVSTVVVLAFASRRHVSPDRLLLAGIAVSSFTSSILSLLLAIGDQRSWQILAWLGGSSNTATSGTASFLVIAAVMVTIVSLLLNRWLTILPLGQAVPVAVGVPLRRARISLIAIAAIATAAASLLVGPLSFVGLMGPHIAYRAGYIGGGQQIVAAATIGALLMIIADFGARTASFPYDLPLGLFAALIGAPYLVWLIVSRK